jgi:hypothetical protein
MAVHKGPVSYSLGAFRFSPETATPTYHLPGGTQQAALGILHAEYTNIPSAARVAPPEGEQVTLETCRGP